MTSKEITQLIKLKKSQVKKLGLADTINHILFGSHKASHVLLWNKSLKTNPTESAQLQDRLGIQAITPKEIAHKTATMKAIELGLGSISLAYALYDKGADYDPLDFAVKDTWFYLWANDELVLTLGTKPAKGFARAQVVHQEVRRFIDGPWVAALEELVKQVKAIESEEQKMIQEERNLEIRTQMENFGIDAVDVTQIKLAQTNRTPFSLSKWFSRSGAAH